MIRSAFCGMLPVLVVGRAPTTRTRRTLLVVDGATIMRAAETDAVEMTREVSVQTNPETTSVAKFQ